MLFKYWNYTTCIYYENLAFLEETIIKLLEQEEGCYRIRQLPQLDCEVQKLRIRPWLKLPKLWIIALFKSQSGWTIIKTFPKGLFCRRASNINHPRLSNLTKQLNCKAFHLEVHHDHPEFLLETDATGRTFLSGCMGTEAPDNIQFYEEKADLLGLIQKFSLIEVSDLFQAAIQINKDPKVKRQKAEAEQLMKKIESWEYEEFDLIKEACKSYMERIDHKLAEVICNNNSFWYIKNLAYNTYNDSPKLRIDNLKLLYFHPPVSYELPRANIIFSPPSTTSENTF